MTLAYILASPASLQTSLNMPITRPHLQLHEYVETSAEPIITCHILDCCRWSDVTSARESVQSIAGQIPVPLLQATCISAGLSSTQLKSRQVSQERPLRIETPESTNPSLQDGSELDEVLDGLDDLTMSTSHVKHPGILSLPRTITAENISHSLLSIFTSTVMQWTIESCSLHYIKRYTMADTKLGMCYLFRRQIVF